MNSILKSLTRPLCGFAVLLSIAISTVAFSSSAFSQEIGVSVEGDESTGVDAQLRGTVVELAKNAVGSESGYKLIGDGVKGTASVRLVTKVLKLGESYIVTINRIEGGSITFSAKLKATTADDLDTVTPRVVKAALKGKKTEDTAEVDTVSNDEKTRGNNRIEATRQWKFGFGPAWGSGLNTDKSGMNYILGFAWGLDANWEIDLSWRIASIEKSGESGATFSSFEIGGSYYFTRQKTSPYLTAGFGRGGALASRTTSGIFSISDDSASGWSGRVGAGLKFFRTSTVNLGIELDHSMVFAETSYSKKNPGVTSLNLAVYF